MAYPDRVVGRMVSNLWFQIGSQAPAAAGVGGSGSSGVTGLRNPPALFGVPEHVPELTYIVQAFPGDNGFIQSAIDYHRTYGLVPATHTAAHPVTFTSIENLLNILQQNSSHIGRLRIVAHVGLDTRAGADANMNVAFFQGGRPGVRKTELQGFAHSDEAGLRALLGVSNPTSPSSPLFNSLVTEILQHLRSSTATSGVLAPFGLQSSGTPSGLLEQYFFVLSDLLFSSLVFANAANGSIEARTAPATDVAFNAAQRASLTGALTIIRDRIESQLVSTAGHALAELHALHDAVLPLTMANLNATNLGGRNFVMTRTTAAGVTIFLDPMQDVGAAVAAINNRNFRQNLTSTRARFDQNSWIDIRGCRIGQDPDYLQAIREFFGRSGNLPSASGPEWFQSFPRAASRSRGSEAQIDDWWTNGSSFTAGSQTITHSAATIQSTFDRVETLSGVDIHIDFWRQVSGLDPVEFAAMLWKSDFPALPIDAPQLDGFTGLDFSDTINRIAAIFDLAGSSPANSTLTRIEGVHPQLVALQSEIIVISELASQSAPLASELSQSYDRLRQISQQLGLPTVPATAPSPLQVTHLQTFAERLKKHFQIVVIPGGPANFYQTYLGVEELAALASPPASDLTQRFNELSAIQGAVGAAGIVPASEPAGLDAATLQSYIQPLIDHLNASADLISFRQAVHTKTQQQRPQVPATFRYYFFIGLTLLVDELNNWCFFALDSQVNPAIRSFMAAHWQGTLPTPNGVAGARMNQNAARQVSMLTETDAAGNDIAQYINPYPQFDAHIRKVP